MESSRPWPWPRGSSRPANDVLGLEARVLGLGLGCQVLGLGLEGQGLGLACGGLDSKSGFQTVLLILVQTMSTRSAC